MKSKAEEIQQFKDFLATLEVDGYLHGMFNKLEGWVKQQINADWGIDLNSVLEDWDACKQTINFLEGSLRETQENLKTAEQARDSAQKAYLKETLWKVIIFTAF